MPGETGALSSSESSTTSSRANSAPSLSLQSAVDLQLAAAALGFDWSEVSDVIAKVREEIEEIELALAEQNPEHAKRELGDLLFSVVNLARFLNAVPDDELALACERFTRRFERVKEEIASSGKVMKHCSLEELDAVWNRVKHESA